MSMRANDLLTFINKEMEKGNLTHDSKICCNTYCNSEHGEINWDMGLAYVENNTLFLKEDR